MKLPRRNAARLREYDHSAPGTYFVAVRTAGRRNERGRPELWAYIDENPAKWTLDSYYSE